MHTFLVLGLPVGFIFLVLAFYPREEFASSKRSYLLGLITAVPVYLAARLTGLFVAPDSGSILLVFQEWTDRILPYSLLPIFLYMIFYRLDRSLPPGAAERRLTAFHAGALSPVGLGEMARTWGNPEPYVLLMLPLILVSIILVMPNLATRIYRSYGFRLVFLVSAALAGSWVVSMGPWLFIARLWPFAWLLAVVFCLCAWFMATPTLARVSPVPVE
jgi:hypothetical protein